MIAHAGFRKILLLVPWHEQPNATCGQAARQPTAMTLDNTQAAAWGTCVRLLRGGWRLTFPRELPSPQRSAGHWAQILWRPQRACCWPARPQSPLQRAWPERAPSRTRPPILLPSCHLLQMIEVLEWTATVKSKSKGYHLPSYLCILVSTSPIIAPRILCNKHAALTLVYAHYSCGMTGLPHCNFADCFIIIT